MVNKIIQTDSLPKDNMAELTNKILNDDFVWDLILDHVSGKRKSSSKQFININCPYCPELGESIDTRMRCGIRKNYPGVGIHCFNCGLKTKWAPGDLIPKKMQRFMFCLGVNDGIVKQANHKAFRYRSFLTGSTNDKNHIVERGFSKPIFQDSMLPKGSKSFSQLAQENCTDNDFIETVAYLYDRGDEIAEFGDYFWTSDTTNNLNRRVTVPFYDQNRIVGYTSRLIDNDKTKNRYIKSTQEDFLFNIEKGTHHSRQYIIVVEGIFDAIAIDCVSSLGSSLTQTQVQWLASFGRKIIIVPDPDKAGQHLIDVAVNNNWSVAFPRLRQNNSKNNWWDASVKDVAEAVKTYGQIYTLQSIISTSSNNNLEINFKRKLLF